MLLQFFKSSRFILGLDKILSALPDCFTGADSLFVKTGLVIGKKGQDIETLKNLLGFEIVCT